MSALRIRGATETPLCLRNNTLAAQLCQDKIWVLFDYSLDSPDWCRPTLVAILLACSCPTAIFGRIRTIVIDSIDASRSPAGLIAHVLDKIPEAIAAQPAAANVNTPIAIRRTLSAAYLDSLPCSVERMMAFGALLRFGRLVFLFSTRRGNGLLLTQATTALTFTSYQLSCNDASRRAAITNTNPTLTTIVSIGVLVNNMPPPKTMARLDAAAQTSTALTLAYCKMTNSNVSFCPAITTTTNHSKAWLRWSWTNDEPAAVSLAYGKVVAGSRRHLLEPSLSRGAL